jgi:hypothetical protein
MEGVLLPLPSVLEQKVMSQRILAGNLLQLLLRLLAMSVLLVVDLAEVAV